MNLHWHIIMLKSPPWYACCESGQMSTSHRILAALKSSISHWLPQLLLPWGFTRASMVAQLVKNLPAMQETRVQSLVRKIPWTWQPTPEFLPGESHGQRSLVGYSPWGHKESDMTEWLNFNLNCCFTLQTLKLSTVSIVPSFSKGHTVGVIQPLAFSGSFFHLWMCI